MDRIIEQAARAHIATQHGDQQQHPDGRAGPSIGPVIEHPIGVAGPPVFPGQRGLAMRGADIAQPLLRFGDAGASAQRRLVVALGGGGVARFVQQIGHADMGVRVARVRQAELAIDRDRGRARPLPRQQRRKGMQRRAPGERVLRGSPPQKRARFRVKFKTGGLGAMAHSPQSSVFLLPL